MRRKYALRTPPITRIETGVKTVRKIQHPGVESRHWLVFRGKEVIA